MNIDAFLVQAREQRAPRQFWELGAVGQGLGFSHILRPPLPELPFPNRLPPAPNGNAVIKLPIDLDPSDDDGEATPPPATLQEELNVKYKFETDERLHALNDWEGIVNLATIESSLYVSASQHGRNEVKSSLESAMRPKASKTIANRAAALLKFLAWKKQQDYEPFPVSEDEAYDYIQFLDKTDAPPTSALAFKQALGFAKGMIGLKGVDEILASARFRGAVEKVYRKKAPKKTKDPWTVKELSLIHI